MKSWHFIYAVYHGKCLLWALSHFYGDNEDTPTCFVGNSSVCSNCGLSEAICQETVDIQSYLVVLLHAINVLRELGLEGATKTLITAILLKTGSNTFRNMNSYMMLPSPMIQFWDVVKLLMMFQCHMFHGIMFCMQLFTLGS